MAANAKAVEYEADDERIIIRSGNQGCAHHALFLFVDDRRCGKRSDPITASPLWPCLRGIIFHNMSLYCQRHRAAMYTYPWSKDSQKCTIDSETKTATPSRTESILLIRTFQNATRICMRNRLRPVRWLIDSIFRTDIDNRVHLVRIPSC